MLSQNATVLKVTNDYLEVMPSSSGCHACGTNTKSGCGVSNFSALFNNPVSTLKVSNPGGFKNNDQVELLMSESVFLRGVLFQYLLPLIIMLLSVLCADLLGAGVVASLTAAMAGLIGGIGFARHLINHKLVLTSPHNITIRHLNNDSAQEAQSIRILAG